MGKASGLPGETGNSGDSTPPRGRLAGAGDPGGESDPWRGLAAEILHRAIRDLADVEHAREAAGWLQGEWAAELLAGLGFDRVDVLERLGIAQGGGATVASDLAKRRVAEFVGNDVVASIKASDALPTIITYGLAEAEERAPAGAIPGCVLHQRFQTYDNALLVVRLADFRKLRAGGNGSE